MFGLDPVENPVGTLAGSAACRRTAICLTVRIAADEVYAGVLPELGRGVRRSYVRRRRRSERREERAGAGDEHRPICWCSNHRGPDLVRRDILGAIVRPRGERVVSSHLLDEVERVADQVAIIHQGRILLTAPMDEIKETHAA